MCDPVTMTAVAVAGAAVTMGGQYYAGTAARNQAIYESQVADQNARLANDQARDAQDRGAIAAQQQYRRVAALKGQQQAAMAANGIDIGFGSALDVQRDTSMMGAEDANTLYRNTASEVKGYEINAANYKSQSAADKVKASNAMTSAYFGMASTALGAATQIGGMQAKMKAGG